MSQEKGNYLSYQLRLKRANEQGESVWRVSLQNARTHESKNFAGLDDLFVFLWQQIGVSKEAEDITGDNSSESNELNHTE